MTINVWEFLRPTRPLEMTVWKDEDDEEGQTFQSKIQEIGNGRFFLSPPTALFQELKETLVHGMLVGVTMSTEKGPVIFYPKMAVCQVDHPAGFWFSVPADTQAEMVFRREFIRVELNRPIKIEYPVSHDKWETINGQAEDLSGGGIKFYSSKLLAKNLRIYVYLQLHDDQPVMKLDTRVVMSGEVTIGEDIPYGMKYSSACQFMNISEQHQTAIVGECFRLQLARNRKNNE